MPSLDHWSETPFEKLSASRREFLQWSAALAASVANSSCTRSQPEHIVPYARMPEDIIPGRPLFYSTAMPLGGYGFGLVVESHLGRPTKVEGNEFHPASLGGTDAFGQASVLSLYDPDRGRAVRGESSPVSTWNAYQKMVSTSLSPKTRLRILTGRITSPSTREQLQRVLQKFPLAQWHAYEPVLFGERARGAAQTFGREVDSYYDIARTDCIVSFDDDWLFVSPGRLRHARDWADGRDPSGASRFKRLYMAEMTASLTGAAADDRLGLARSRVGACLIALAKSLGVLDAAPTIGTEERRWVNAASAALRSSPGRGLVTVGESLPSEFHSLALHLNARLHNLGTTHRFIEPLCPWREDMGSLQQLTRDMDRGLVDAIWIAGVNAVYDAPADLNFRAALTRVPRRIYFGAYPDETAKQCHWYLPASHFLESWGDIRAFDGSVTIVQPLILPLYDGKTLDEGLGTLVGPPTASPYDRLRQLWSDRGGREDRKWRSWLNDGLIPQSASPILALPLKNSPRSLDLQIDSSLESKIDVRLVPDPSAWDGAFSNNAWLQELPKPITTLVWDNAFYLSSNTAKKLGVANGSRIRVAGGGQTQEGAVLIVPRQPDGVATLSLGYGRAASGRIGNAIGIDGYALRTTGSPWGQTASVQVVPAPPHALIVTQAHHQIEGRDLVRLIEYAGEPKPSIRGSSQASEQTKSRDTLEIQRRQPAWAMVIDLSRCTGCNACVVACQAENNIPTVGKEECARERDMHWIRVDHYEQPSSVGSPRSAFQPVPCMHCETAPCEVVCPVAATVHTGTGINQMVYNRCVGTRYCSNNCPYKVRRFNFFDYRDPEKLAALQKNPDVTVRERGVMEKCTYCIQRIQSATIDAKKERRALADGEIRTACQQACPSRAIVFGDASDPKSAVSRQKRDPRNYSLLEDLNTRPRTTYQARVVHPHEGVTGGGRARDSD